jgi:hypothetical protein
MPAGAAPKAFIENISAKPGTRRSKSATQFESFQPTDGEALAGTKTTLAACRLKRFNRLDGLEFSRLQTHTADSMAIRKSDLARCLQFLLLVVSLLGTSIARADAPTALREQYASLGEKLSQSPFQRPLILDSTEAPDRVQGDVLAVINFPFATVKAGLNSPDHWCDVMILHINTKYCRASTGPTGTLLRVHIGRKTPETLADSVGVDFNYRVAAASDEYLDIFLNAAQGPMGTCDYRIRLEAVPLPGDITFLHLSYAYCTSLVGRLAMETYLATLGSDKVGFTVIGTLADGQPEFIGGLRGVVERNTMRYYLAIDAFLEAEMAAPAERLERRMQNWFTATESYPRQLYEMDRASYLDMKRAEVARQNSLAE